MVKNMLHMWKIHLVRSVRLNVIKQVVFQSVTSVLDQLQMMTMHSNMTHVIITWNAHDAIDVERNYSKFHAENWDQLWVSTDMFFFNGLSFDQSVSVCHTCS